ncbi:ESX secretion-associated protein EspG [Nocardia yunnanensis]|uniref:ESX secretion-associated protein EspG n=1 Tax=Nocardia yunnanensis TaxID=2382165 RepID=A0A386ZK86_9NOCA|nr:ESX secretion-associated protein EspG [Nocardia yunnanensis]AYF77049.1 ESX secretion-associated protein EspG [Nocardia yunnanensis]
MIWDFSDDEFIVLCNRYLDGDVPFPLTYTSRHRYEDDERRALSEVSERLGTGLFAEIKPVFEILADPDLVIAAHARHDDDLDNPALRIRVHAARRGRRAVLVTMKPGETIYHSGGFTLTECEPEELPALVVAQLPATDAGGGPVVPLLSEPEERDPFEVRQSLAFDSFEETSESRSAAFWAASAEWNGFIRVRQGRSIYGPRGVMDSLLAWRDLRLDGRYLFEVGVADAQAVPVSPLQLTERVDARMWEVLSHREDRGE